MARRLFSLTPTASLGTLSPMDNYIVNIIDLDGRTRLHSFPVVAGAENQARLQGIGLASQEGLLYNEIIVRVTKTNEGASNA